MVGLVGWLHKSGRCACLSIWHLMVKIDREVSLCCSPCLSVWLVGRLHKSGR